METKGRHTTAVRIDVPGAARVGDGARGLALPSRPLAGVTGGHTLSELLEHDTDLRRETLCEVMRQSKFRRGDTPQRPRDLRYDQWLWSLATRVAAESRIQYD